MTLFALCLLFGLAGLGVEIFATAKGTHKMGYSSAFYFPLYAAAPAVLELAGARWFTVPWILRTLAYVPAIYAVEFLAMAVLRWILGSSPSEASYVRSRWNVAGLIRLDLAPAWWLAGALLEWLYRCLRI